MQIQPSKADDRGVRWCSSDDCEQWLAPIEHCFECGAPYDDTCKLTNSEATICLPWLWATLAAANIIIQENRYGVPTHSVVEMDDAEDKLRKLQTLPDIGPIVDELGVLEVDGE